MGICGDVAKFGLIKNETLEYKIIGSMNDNGFDYRPFNLGQWPAILVDHEILVVAKVAWCNDFSFCIFYTMIYFPLICF